MSAVSTGLISSTEQTRAAAERGVISAIIAIADGTNQATVELFDGTADTDTLIAKVTVDAGLVHEQLVLPTPVRFTQGLYTKITGTGAGAVIHIA